MTKIRLATAIALSTQSERTLRRRIAEGGLTRLVDEGSMGRVMVLFQEIEANFCVRLDEEDIELVIHADEGDAEAQNELALLMLSNGKPERALYWLELAAKQGYADAMHLLGSCHLFGNGTAQNEDLAVMWLAKAAAHGHAIAKLQMQALKRIFR